MKTASAQLKIPTNKEMRQRMEYFMAKRRAIGVKRGLREVLHATGWTHNRTRDNWLMRSCVRAEEIDTIRELTPDFVIEGDVTPTDLHEKIDQLSTQLNFLISYLSHTDAEFHQHAIDALKKQRGAR